ncbi:MAG: DNA helicase UvrD [Deltaproteobacteria bacterium]|nr:DNA helicase UvrD [Deltaproteobacteria bacterium]
MRIIADLHIHTKYSRATSKDMNLSTLASWAGIKGIDVLGTGDFTHPAQFASIEETLETAEDGLFKLKKDKSPEAVRFMLTAEVSNIFSQNGKTRKVHSLLLAPDVKSVRKMNSAFSKLGNIASDGRPIFGFSAKDLLKIVLDASPEAMLIPAHAWTPWFSIFGSKSGFDSIQECFGDLSKHIYAIETGLSSNPQMNWRLSSLDNITFISNSDAHSPSKLGREANVLDADLSYSEITGIIKKKDREKFLFTVEFYPEEGKYHYDGHRDCKVRYSPAETIKANKTCPVCAKGLTVGVMSRVAELSDRPEGFTPPNAIPARHMVPLEEILSETLEVCVSSNKVKKEYRRLITEAGSEFSILLDMEEADLIRLAGEKTASAISKVRSGDISITPGFDGEFGKIKIFSKTADITASPLQPKLF